jgi:sugar phosphate isomerase/epimerase
VAVAVEYMAWTTPNGPEEALGVARATGCGVVVDLLHHLRVGAGPDELTALVSAGAVAWVQVCDAPLPAPDDLVAEARHGRLPPGDGELPLTELLRIVPPHLPWSVEVQSDRLASELAPPARARRLAEATRALARRVEG